MSLYEIYQPSTPHFNNVNPFPTIESTFSHLFSITENSPEIFSPSTQFLDTNLSDYEYIDHFPLNVDELRTNSSPHDFQMDLDEFDSMFADHPDAHGDMTSICMHPSLILPFEGMEVDNHLSLINLLVAYSEAMDHNQETELSEVIARRIIQKVNPVGETSERVLYYMFQHLNKKPKYLKEESFKNFYPAFKVFYQMFPYGKFAHFVANSAIMESLPRDAEIIHLIDFDIGEGLQWASFIEAIKHQHKEIRLTSIKFDIEEDENYNPFRWRFDETKRRLHDHASSYGINIIVEEVALQELESLMTKIKKGDYHGRKSRYHVFNCHVGLPHMMRIRSKKHVFEFLRYAEDFLHRATCSGGSGTSNYKGIITYGDGDVLFDHTTHTSSSISSYSSFLDANFAHYQALLESMEFDFPKHLGEARRALECLFVAPFVSSISWGRKWEEINQCGGEVEFGLGLEGLRYSEANIDEARELVNEGISGYGVRIEGEKKNEIVMKWNGISIVRVCCWKS